MKKNLLTFFVATLLAAPALIAQKNTDKLETLYVYRTEEDFFNKKDKAFAKVVSADITLGNVDYYDANNVRHKNFNLSDSAIFGISQAQFQYIHDGLTNYSLFCGGNKDYYVTSALSGFAEFDEDGFIKSFRPSIAYNTSYSYGYTEFWFIDKIHHLETKNIEDILKNNPALLDQYLAEKTGTGKKEWKKNQHYIAIKYFKLFIKAASK